MFLNVSAGFVAIGSAQLIRDYGRHAGWPFFADHDVLVQVLLYVPLAPGARALLARYWMAASGGAWSLAFFPKTSVIWFAVFVPALLVAAIAVYGEERGWGSFSSDSMRANLLVLALVLLSWRLLSVPSIKFTDSGLVQGGWLFPKRSIRYSDVVGVEADAPQRRISVRGRDGTVIVHTVRHAAAARF